MIHEQHASLAHRTVMRPLWLWRITLSTPPDPFRPLPVGPLLPFIPHLPLLIARCLAQHGIRRPVSAPRPLNTLCMRRTTTAPSAGPLAQTPPLRPPRMTGQRPDPPLFPGSRHWLAGLGERASRGKARRDVRDEVVLAVHVERDEYECGREEDEERP
jgi:hypothetical protein